MCLQKLSFEENFTMFNTSAFGANVLQDILVFATEEARYASFREKQPSFSLCGRVIASPDIDGVKLLRFSDNMGTCSSPVSTKRTACPMDSLFNAGYWPSSSPSPLQQVAQLPGNHKVSGVLQVLSHRQHAACRRRLRHNCHLLQAKTMTQSHVLL